MKSLFKRWYTLVPLFLVATATIAHAIEAPTGVSATLLAAKKMRLRATATSGLIVRFERATSITGTYSKAKEVVAAASSSGVSQVEVIDTKPSVGKKYCYRAQTKNTSGKSAYTTPICLTATIGASVGSSSTPPPLPAAPTSLVASGVGETSAVLSWSDQSSNESGFVLERAPAMTGPFAIVASVGANVSSFTDSSLKSSTPYFYRVKASSAFGSSAYSNLLSIRSLDPPLVNRPPFASILAPSSAFAGAIISVSAAGSFDTDGVIVRANVEFGDGATAQGLVASHSYAAPGIYTIRVTVADDAGAEASQSSPIVISSAPLALSPSLVATAISGNAIRNTGLAASLDLPVVRTDALGNLYYGGKIEGRPYLVKQDREGQVLWSWKSVSSPGTRGSGIVEDIAIDAFGNVFITGAFTLEQSFRGQVSPFVCSQEPCVDESIHRSAGYNLNPAAGPVGTGGHDVFVVKLASDGSYVWSRRFGGLDGDASNIIETAHAISADPRGGAIVIAGRFAKTIDCGLGVRTSPAPQSLFIAKLSSSDGSCLWDRVAGNPYGWGAYARGAVIDATGSVFVAGEFRSDMDFGAGMISPVALDGAIPKMFLVKYSEGGSVTWFKQFANVIPEKMLMDSRGDLVISAQSLGGDWGLGRLDKNLALGKFSGVTGAALWSKSFNAGSFYGTARALAIDGLDRITFADNVIAYGGPTNVGLGPVQAPTAGQNFSMLAQFDSQGRPLFSRYVGMAVRLRGVAVRDDGHIFLSGSFWSDLSLDDVSLISLNGSDNFLIEFAATPAN